MTILKHVKAIAQALLILVVLAFLYVLIVETVEEGPSEDE